MFFFFLCLVIDSPSLTPVLLELGADEMADPQDIVTWDHGYYVLDTKLVTIFSYTASGKLERKFGKQGQGPDEMLKPIALGVDEDSSTLYVYDRDKASIFAFNSKGEIRNQAKTIRGSFAQFYDGKLLIHSPFEDFLFLLVDLNGEVLARLGKGPGNGPINPLDALKYVKKFFYEEKLSDVFAISLTGGRIERYPLTQAPSSFNLQYNFDVLIADQKIASEGDGIFTIDNHAPVLSLQRHRDKFLLLVENEQRGLAKSLLVFGENGKFIQQIQLTKDYKRIKTIENLIALTDGDNAQIDVFELKVK